MEFFLVPLLAIAGVTAGIYKLAGLVFHIRLSWGLLAMLVGFAWLTSLVLPGVFYHSAGFLGSVGISLVCAVGFALLATVYDARTHATQKILVLAEPPNSAPESTRIPATEAAILQEPLSVAVLTEIAREVAGRQNVQSEQLELPAQNNYVIEIENKEPATTMTASTAVSPLAEAEMEGYIPVATEDYYTPGMLRTPKKDSEEVTDGFFEARPTKDPIEKLEEAPKERPEEPSGFIMDALDALAEENTLPAEQPASDSLEDLLDFAFEQRNRRNISGALDAFRLIGLQYGDSEAVPMVAAELVSTLQSCGDYDGAQAELAQALQLPLVQRDSRLVQVFTRKQKYLQALQALLREQGQPNLPFEQIPIEWSDWLNEN